MPKSIREASFQEDLWNGLSAAELDRLEDFESFELEEIETEEQSGFLVVCQKGHEISVTPDMRIYHRCQEREDQGFLDALMISSSQCPSCVEDAIDNVNLALDTCGDDPVGCGLGTSCTLEGCQLLREKQGLIRQREEANKLF